MPVSRGWSAQIPRAYRTYGLILVQPTGTGGYIPFTAFGGQVASPAVVAGEPVQPQPAGVGRQAYYDLVMARASLVAYWRGDEVGGPTFLDSKNGPTGVLNATRNGTISYGIAGALVDDANTAIGMTGNATNNWLNVPDSAALDLGDGPLTYITWYKRLAAGIHSSCLIGKGSNAPFLIVDDLSLGSIEWYSRGVGLAAHSSTALTETTTFHQIAGTKALAGAWRLFLDGVDVTVVDGTPATSNTAADFALGRDPAGAGGSYMDGYMDETSIYNTVLTPSEILTDYLTGKAIFAAIHTDEPTDLIAEA